MNAPGGAVHILWINGYALCDDLFVDPRAWPPGHSSVRWPDVEGATCAVCLKREIARRERASEPRWNR